jgi:hypothetical protein
MDPDRGWYKTFQSLNHRITNRQKRRRISSLIFLANWCRWRGREGLLWDKVSSRCSWIYEEELNLWPLNNWPCTLPLDHQDKTIFLLTLSCSVVQFHAFHPVKLIDGFPFSLEYSLANRNLMEKLPKRQWRHLPSVMSLISYMVLAKTFSFLRLNRYRLN